MLSRWLEAECANLLALPSRSAEAELVGCRLCRLVQIIDNEKGDGPCLAHLADTDHYILAVLGDGPIAKLSRRFSFRPLSSFAGALIEVKKGKLKVTSKSTANVVLFVEDFVMVGGVVGVEETVGDRPFIMQAEQVKQAATSYIKSSVVGSSEDSCDLLALDTLCSQYNTCPDDSSDSLSIDEEDCIIPHKQALIIEAMVEGRDCPPIDPESIGLLSSQSNVEDADEQRASQPPPQAACPIDSTQVFSQSSNHEDVQPKPAFNDDADDDIVETQQIQINVQEEIIEPENTQNQVNAKVPHQDVGESIDDAASKASRDSNHHQPNMENMDGNGDNVQTLNPKLPSKRKLGSVIDYSSLDPDYLVRVAANSLLCHLNPSVQDDCEYAVKLYIDLLRLCASEEFNTVKQKNVFPNTLIHRRKCRMLQSCLVLWPMLDKCVNDIHELLWLNIGRESMPSTRCYFEWMLASGYVKGRFPLTVLLDRLKNYHGNAAMSISVLTISFLTGMKRADFRDVFFDHALPYFIHNNHAVRMFIIFIWGRLSESKQSQAKITSSSPGHENLTQFIRSSEHCQKFVDKLKNEHMLKAFDLDQDLNIQFIFSEFPRRLGMAIDEMIAFPSFLNVDPEPGFVDLQPKDRVYSFEECNEALEQQQQIPSTSASSRYQQKMVPIELAEAEEEIQGAKRADALRTKIQAGRLIVLGSFIDKIPNLAGLARTCEVMGAISLCLPSLSIVESNDFQAVCMTADKWLDLKEVRGDQVVGYLEEMRSLGFRIVAVEQSSSSVQLSKYNFHKDTVLVLGNEQSGVPADILHLVDDCVEIPQFGMVRSMNVHVTGSIVLWEARKQLSGL